ncbi:hypothetical protein WA158_005519 [Blastocystis sp. Blastoise]
MDKQQEVDKALQDQENKIQESNRKRRLELLEEFKKQHKEDGTSAVNTTSPIENASNDIQEFTPIPEDIDKEIKYDSLEMSTSPKPNSPSTDKNDIASYSKNNDDSENSEDSSSEDSSELDMFASDDEFDRKLEKIKATKNQESVVQNSTKNENLTLVDNWDDEEGYYKPYVGELFSYHYQIINENGKGVFSSVLRCTDTNTNEQVAIKVIRNKEKMREAGRKEIDILSEIKEKDKDNKRHCIPIYDHFIYRNHLCIVFPYMEMNLRDALHKYGIGVGLSFRAVRSFAHQLFISLIQTSSLYIIHADLKPDNVLLKNATSTEIQLSDFGSAFHTYDIDNISAPYLVSRYYRAPEIILGLKSTPAIDVWSVGCVLYELFTGKPVFPGESNNDMLKYIQDYMGSFPHKILRKHISSYQLMGKEPFFTNDYEFNYYKLDPVTQQPVIKKELYTQKRRSFEKDILEHKHRNDDKSELKQFADFLERCFLLDPEKRMTPREALHHPYLNQNKN